MQALTTLSVCLLIYAALHDMAARTVPNWVSVALLAPGVALQIYAHSLGISLVIACGYFCFLYLLWLAGVMGAGDVKLWTAASLLVPARMQPQLEFILTVTLTGGGLAIAYLLLRYLVPCPAPSKAGTLLLRCFRVEAWRINRQTALPYAVSISAGAVMMLVRCYGT